MPGGGHGSDANTSPRRPPALHPPGRGRHSGPAEICQVAATTGDDPDLAVIAEFEANLIRRRTREGMDIARQNGNLRGKQPVLKPARDREIRRIHDSGDHSVAEIAALFSVSRPTVYRSLERTTALPPLPAEARPAPDVAKYDQLLTCRPG